MTLQSLFGWLWTAGSVARQSGPCAPAPAPAPTPAARNPNCIYDEQELRDVIHAGGEAKLCSVCYATDQVQLTSEIDITDKSFSITCLYNDDSCSHPRSTCSIYGAGGHRLFSGAPTSALFDSIDFTNGEADRGGAFHLTGGVTQLNKCEFNWNAGGDGGALYVAGASTEVTMTTTGSSSFNTATSYGAFILATDGSTVIMDGTDDIGISLNQAKEMGGFVAATNGANVVINDVEISCGNQAKNGGDYFYIADGASVECQGVTFEVPATSTADEVPPPFNSPTGIIGDTPTCKASEQVGASPSCKRQF